MSAEGRQRITVRWQSGWEMKSGWTCLKSIYGPNVKHGGIAFGQNPASVEEITREIKRYAKQPVIMKLSPNVTDITEMARAAQSGGADAISMINTLTGMKIDVERGTFAIANQDRRCIRSGSPSDRSAYGI